MTVQPDWTARGANLRATSLPALKMAILISLKLVSLSVSTGISKPLNRIVLPPRDPATSFKFLIRKLRSSSSLTTSRPTAPVAPITATLN